MKKRFMSILLTLVIILTMLPSTSMAAGSTKTINLNTLTLEISNVYDMDSSSKSSSDGYTTTYCVVVPASATIKIKRATNDNFSSYLLRPFNDIKFNDGAMHPYVEFSCEVEDCIYVPFTEGSTITTVVNNEYLIQDSVNYRNFNLRIFVVDDEQLVQFGGPKPTKKTDSFVGTDLATPSKTGFVVEGKSWKGEPQKVTQAYSINQTNYLQLRAIAVLLNRTPSQFDIGWDGEYAVIEPGKPFTGSVIGSKMQDTRNVRNSNTKFKMNGEVFSFDDARLINGSTNYIQLREFAKKLSGTASQFNLYWDGALDVAVIEPGVPYIGTKKEASVTILQQVKGEGDILPDGNYYLKISGKYVAHISGGQYWLELRNERPDHPFNIKLIKNSEEHGPMYSIGYDGTYIMLPGSLNGAQLQSTTSRTPHYWKISMDTDFGTIRDYKNQKILVNASGKTRAGNTTVVGSSSTGSAPDHGKITFYKEVDTNNVKSVVQILSYPTKVKYKLGEGFDSTGVNAVITKGSVDTSVNDQSTFYTSKTVELKDGRPFTTPGTKVVEIRYEGMKFAEYTIVVTEN